MLKNFLLKNWKMFIGPTLPEVIQVAPITSCVKDYGNDVVLIFINNQVYPKYVMKVSRNPFYGLKLKNEYYALKSLKKIKNLAHYIPIPYYLGHFGENIFFIQDGVPGTSFFRMIKKRRQIEDCYPLIIKAIDLLVSINLSKISYNKRFSRKSDKIGYILKRHENEFINIGINIKKIEEIKECWAQFEKQGKYFFLHGDYWHANIIIDEKDKIINSVIDWEFSKSRVSIPTDIIGFMIILGYCLYLKINPASDILDSFKWAFFKKGVHNEILSSIFQRYTAATGWDQSFFRVLLEMTLVEMSVRELINYGCHFKQDKVYRKMLRYTVDNEINICLY